MNASGTKLPAIELARIRISDYRRFSQQCFKLRSAADPPLPGTDVPVRRIAALIRLLARGRLDLSDSEAAFPALSRDQILKAFRHSRARPERDREPTADRLVTALDRIEQMWRSGKFGRGLVA